MHFVLVNIVRDNNLTVSNQTLQRVQTVFDTCYYNEQKFDWRWDLDYDNYSHNKLFTYDRRWAPCSSTQIIILYNGYVWPLEPWIWSSINENVYIDIVSQSKQNVFKINVSFGWKNIARIKWLTFFVLGLYLIDDFPDMTLAPINVKLHSTELSSVGRVLLTSQASSSSLESPSFDSPRPMGSSSITPGSYKKQKG